MVSRASNDHEEKDPGQVRDGGTNATFSRLIERDDADFSYGFANRTSATAP